MLYLVENSEQDQFIAWALWLGTVPSKTNKLNAVSTLLSLTKYKSPPDPKYAFMIGQLCILNAGAIGISIEDLYDASLAGLR